MRATIACSQIAPTSNAVKQCSKASTAATRT
jgi:hypothetical protein